MKRIKCFFGFHSWEIIPPDPEKTWIGIYGWKRTCLSCGKEQESGYGETGVRWFDILEKQNDLDILLKKS